MTTTTPSSSSTTASDLVASVVRTIVPYVAGLILAWVASFHLPFTVGPAARRDRP